MKSKDQIADEFYTIFKSILDNFLRVYKEQYMEARDNETERKFLEASGPRFYKAMDNLLKNTLQDIGDDKILRGDYIQKAEIGKLELAHRMQGLRTRSSS